MMESQEGEEETLLQRPRSRLDVPAFCAGLGSAITLDGAPLPARP